MMTTLSERLKAAATSRVVRKEHWIKEGEETFLTHIPEQRTVANPLYVEAAAEIERLTALVKEAGSAVTVIERDLTCRDDGTHYCGIM